MAAFGGDGDAWMDGTVCTEVDDTRCNTIEASTDVYYSTQVATT